MTFTSYDSASQHQSFHQLWNYFQRHALVSTCISVAKWIITASISLNTAENSFLKNSEKLSFQSTIFSKLEHFSQNMFKFHILKKNVLAPMQIFPNGMKDHLSIFFALVASPIQWKQNTLSLIWDQKKLWKNTNPNLKMGG